MWLETGGVVLSPRLTRILLKRECADIEQLTVWQLEPFDELISMEVPICLLRDRGIELGFEVSGIDNIDNMDNVDFDGTGKIKIFQEEGVLKSGLLTVILNAPNHHEADDIVTLEDRLYRRKSKQVPQWYVQLMKERLRQLKREFLERNPKCMFINVIIPIPSHPLRLKLSVNPPENSQNKEDLCAWDVIESAEDSSIKRRHPQLFEVPPGVSNGDLRAIHGILQRGYDASAIDSANLLWSKREYLSKNFPSALVSFIQSVQWWLSASDPTEIDEALRIIEGWRVPSEAEDCEEVCAILLVKMSKIMGLSDSQMWIGLFERLLLPAGEPINFIKKYQSSLILFLTSSAAAGMPELRGFLMKSLAVVQKDVGLASELYWRLKVDDGCVELFEEYCESLGSDLKAEIKKQERLFEGIDRILQTAQKLKGPRTAKLELLKQLLVDPEASEIPSATQANPLLPGLQGGGGDGRIKAVVADRCNLFKSTAFTVLMVFLRQDNAGGLPIIFKKGDDLRRDSACLRVFRAIWDIWRRDGDLNLFPRRLLYGVVPLSKDFGLVEFVESVPLSKVVVPSGEDTSDEWAVARYLKDTEAKNNFLASCVGFSLLTYLLGIGDRHLDNLLLTPQGHLLHIDFSFVFGADPKPFPPPIKITREMVRGFEVEANVQADGTDTEKWAEFKGLCFTALTLLRRKSSLLTALIEAEYPNHHVEYVDFVKERLNAMSSQAESIQKMDRLLEESRRAMFPQVMETIHKWVQYWKS